MGTGSKRLIVNADDYGYYPFVTASILEGIDKGVITATGMFANCATFSCDVRSLRDRSEVDVGVHLNLTFGEPVTGPMRRCLRHHGGRFAGKWQTIAMLMGWPAARRAAHEEIEGQVLRCFDRGLQIRFLNSHEHVHLLPWIARAVETVAKQMGIRYIRRSASERRAGVSGVSPGLRGRLVDAVSYIHQAAATPQPKLLGLGCSGSLTLDYLGAVLPQLKVGIPYELMCHPGGEPTGSPEVPRHLQAYHDWLGEKRLLLNPQFRELLTGLDIDLIRFRDLEENTVS